MKFVIKFLHFLEDSFLVTLIVSLVLLSLTQIVLRNAGIAGFMWAETAMRVAVLWLAIFGAMRASRMRNHIAMDLLSHYAPLALKKVLHRGVSLACAASCGIAAYYCWDFIVVEYEDGMTAFLNVPVWLTEAIIPFGLSIIALRFFIQCFFFIAPEDEEVALN